MTAADRAKLARILGMLGSEHAGERASAALQAEAFRKRHGMTWEEMIQGKTVYLGGDPPWAKPEPEPPQPTWTPPPEPEPEPEPPQTTYFPFHLPPGTTHPVIARYLFAAAIFFAWSWKTYG